MAKCYYLRILTEVGYIFWFINYDRALRPLRDNFCCHVVSLAKKLIKRLLYRKIKLTMFLKKINI